VSVRHNPVVIAVVVALTLAMGACSAPTSELRSAAQSFPSAESRQVVVKQSLQSDDLLATYLTDDAPGCSAAVGVRGEVLWAAAAGLADLSSRTPLTTDTRFDMASISKQFTATGILLLQREGLLALTDPVSRHLDGLPRWADEVTVGELMNHTARVPDFWVELEKAGIGFTDPADQGTVLAAIAREQELERGEGYAYANAHYVLLAEIVEAVTGQPFAEVVEQRISGPLGLDLPIAPGLVAGDVATPYDTDGTVLRGGWTAYGHSGIITTPAELARWGDQYRLGKLVQADAVAGAITVLDDDGQPKDEQYAAGIRIEPDGSLYHSGRWGGYISDFTISPDRETVIAVACNGRSARRFELADGLREIWAPRTDGERTQDDEGAD
jgi:CubicO group peptidase (beta-lactamase class C family)